ncbi:MAG: hypothetical protein OXI87_07075 [Albidovulum sp.]|nr:hypothetical protein [Albidovulum sp.]
MSARGDLLPARCIPAPTYRTGERGAGIKDWLLSGDGSDNHRMRPNDVPDDHHGLHAKFDWPRSGP